MRGLLDAPLEAGHDNPRGCRQRLKPRERLPRPCRALHLPAPARVRLANRRVVHLQTLLSLPFCRLALFARSRKSWLCLRKTSKMLAQFNQDGRRQMTAAIAWCRRIKRHSLRRPGAGHGGTTCEGANPGFPVNNRKFTGIFSLADFFSRKLNR